MTPRRMRIASAKLRRETQNDETENEKKLWMIIMAQPYQQCLAVVMELLKITLQNNIQNPPENNI